MPALSALPFPPKVQRAVFGAIVWEPERKPPARAFVMDDAVFRCIYEADAITQVRAVKAGMEPRVVEMVADRMHVPKDRLLQTLGLARATVQRKAAQRRPLSSDESSRLLGISRLIGQARAMVEQSGQPQDFDAATWVADWLEQPLPALSGQRPRELMDTAEGQAIVSGMLARMQGGAYA